MSAAVIQMERTPTLYEINDELQVMYDTLDMLDERDPELATPRAELEAKIDELVKVRLQKADSIAHTLTHWGSQVDMAAAEIKRLQSRKARFERHIERLEDCTIRAIELTGKRRIEGDTTTLALKKKPASVVILNDANIPLEYKVHVPETWNPSKDLIKKALKAGVPVAGADLSEDNVRLAIE